MKIQEYAGYIRIQEIAPTRPGMTKPVAGPPQAEQAPLSSVATFSGRSIMLLRLFGSESAEPRWETTLTNDNIGLSSRHFLTAADRDMLADLYGQAYQQGVDLRYVDDLAADLGHYRMFNRVAGNANSGGMFDEAGRAQTFHFTGKDAATANRILDGDAMASSRLDAGFLRFELDPGYSFSHRANFQFLEEVVNKFGKRGVSPEDLFDSRFATYESEGKENFFVELSSEVVRPPSEPDFVNIDDVFHITEAGRKNGFQMINGKPVKVAADKHGLAEGLLTAIEVARMRTIDFLNVLAKS
ncbi:hypothetical protein ACFWP0_10935 [Achromobacter sp. NPDC058515]|uniref:hypothetical protein n=1 Tax=Achromobacter sp. NPDC058515 TaxID=3346533 RepID=UPI003663B01C